MKAWKRIEPTKVTKVGWRTVVTKTFEMPNGVVDTFDSVYAEDQQFAAVIALTADNQVVVARQFRFGPEKIMDELPGGIVEKDEDPEAAVTRELLEETGYHAGQLQDLGVVHKDAYMNATWQYFLATNCTRVGEPQPDEGEFIDVVLMSPDELIASAKAGNVGDAAAVLLAYEELTKRAAA